LVRQGRRDGASVVEGRWKGIATSAEDIWTFAESHSSLGAFMRWKPLLRGAIALVVFAAALVVTIAISARWPRQSAALQAESVALLARGGQDAALIVVLGWKGDDAPRVCLAPPSQKGDTKLAALDCEVSAEEKETEQPFCKDAEVTCARYRTRPHFAELTSRLLVAGPGERGKGPDTVYVVAVERDGEDVLGLDRAPPAGGFRSHPLAIDGVLVAFPGGAGALEQNGNSADRVARLLGRWEITASNAILMILALLLGAAATAFFWLNRGLDQLDFVPADWLDREGSPRKGDPPGATFVSAIHRGIVGVHSEHQGGDAGEMQEELKPYRRQLLGLIGTGPSSSTTPLLRTVLRRCVAHYNAVADAPLTALDAVFDAAARKKEGGFWRSVLELTASFSTAFGFLGTAIGMTKAFTAIGGSASMTSADGFGAAMRIALVTTVVGLLVRLVAGFMLGVYEVQRDERLERLYAYAVEWCSAFSEALRKEPPPNEESS